MKPFLKSFAPVKPVHLAVTLIVAAVISLANPLGLTVSQTMVLAGLLFAVGSWATGALDRTLTSLLLLLIFLIFGSTDPLAIVGFLWSDVLLLIAVSGLLAAALGKNRLLRAWLSRLIAGTAKNRVVFYATPYLLGLLLIFLIPQAFARVVLLAGIYAAVMDTASQAKRERQAVFFYLYVAVTVTYMMFIGGDIVLNFAAVSFGGEPLIQKLDGLTWLLHMGVPGVIVSLLTAFTVRILFRKELPAHPSAVFAAYVRPGNAESAYSPADRAGLIVMAAVMLLWATESLHGIPGWAAALAGVVILFLLGGLAAGDLKAINPRFLIFLTAAFNIGQVLRGSGVMAALMEKLQVLIPDGTSAIFLPALVLFTMVLHMFIGSAVATLSVVLPVLLPLAKAAGIPAVWLTLMCYITVNLHFLMPFHHATMMIGAANGQFTDRHLIRYGLVMTVGVFAVIFGLYLPWWHLIS